MGNFSGTSFPTDRWADSDTGNTLDQAIASIDEAIRHVLGVSTNTLTAPFAITEAGAVTAKVSFAIGTSADIDDILATIPASPGSSEDTELATVEAIRKYVVAGGGDVYLPLAGGNMTGDIVLRNDVDLWCEDTNSIVRKFVRIAAGDTAFTVGDSNAGFDILGAGTRPTYNGGDLALDDHTHTESDITDLGSYLPLDGSEILTGEVSTLAGFTGIGSTVALMHNSDNLIGSAAGVLTVGNGTDDLTFASALARPIFGGTTLALTTDLSDYLPLAGGSMTGNLTLDKTVSPTLSLREAGSATSHLELIDLDATACRIIKTTASGDSNLYIDAFAGDTTSDAFITFFRNSDTTSGAMSFNIYNGSGGAAIQHSFGAKTGVVDLCQQGGGLTVSNGYVNLPYLGSAPGTPVNGMIWMESDGLHLYYAGAEKLVAGV